MTNDDITRLTEAAEKVRAARAALIAEDSQDAVNAFDQAVEDWCELANPTAILSLLQRLREAEDALKPFARAAGNHDKGDNPDTNPVDYYDGLHVGDLRRARTHMEKHHER